MFCTGNQEARFHWSNVHVLQAKVTGGAVPQAVAGNAWHADHILPVYRGGGLCTLENLRTLCVVCHQVRAAQGLGLG